MRKVRFCKRILFSLLLSSLILLLPMQAFSLPGDADDPLVSKSWVDNYVEQTVSALEKRASDLLTRSRELLSRKVVLTVGSKEAMIGNQAYTMDIEPKIVSVAGGGVTLVPLRFLGEALLLTVEWDGVTQSIICYDANTRVVLPLGGATADVNGQSLPLQVPATAENGRALVPLRFISQAFSAAVEWDGAKQQITVNRH